MLGEPYRVRRGDNLWIISRHKLGGGSQWPRIWRYNNRHDVISQTGRGITNPDLIYPDQILLLPIFPGQPRHSGPVVPDPRAGGSGQAQPLREDTGGGSLSDQLPHVTSPMAFKYKLDDIKFPPIVQPGGIIEIKMTGDVVLVSKKTVPALYVTNRNELELQLTSQANHAFGALIADTRIIYDDKSNKITYRSMLVTQSSTPDVPATAVGVEINSQSPIPKFRFEMRFPKLQGNVPDFFYVAAGITVVVEITLTPPPGGPRTQPLRVPDTNWNKVIGTGLVVTGAAIIIGTLVEDFFTVGAGTLDDPVSFAAAAAAFARASTLFRGAAAVLPRMAIPAMTVFTVTVTAAPVPAPQTERR